MSDHVRQQLTALRRELKTANKERRKEIQRIVQDIESQQLDQRYAAQKADMSSESAMLEGEYGRIKRFQDRQERKREKINELAAERERLMTDTRKKILEGPQNDIKENEQFEKYLNQHNLILHEISPDGNCLFAAISHQLTILEKDPGQDLRGLAAGHIRAHPEKYSPFIDFEEHCVSDLSSYCCLVERSGWWGGDIEIHALSDALSLCITVFKTGGIIGYNESCKGNGIVRISYHRHQYTLGAHYNSLIPKQQIG